MCPLGNKQMSSSAWQSTMMNNHGAADAEEAQPRPRRPQLEIINNRTTHHEGQLGTFGEKFGIAEPLSDY